MKQRFVVFGMGRTGSSLLASLLNSHPQIQCEGELFRIGRWSRVLQPIACIWQHCPMPYLAYRQALARYLSHKTVYGFKLHTKLHENQLADTEGFLHRVSGSGWRLIHLERESLCDQVISGLVARQTSRYFGHNRDPEPLVQIVIPVDEFRVAMEQTVRVSQINRAVLADIPHLAIIYEGDLADDVCWSCTIDRICDYLGIPSVAHAECRVAKPWSRPCAEIVVNYAELRSVYHKRKASLPHTS